MSTSRVAPTVKLADDAQYPSIPPGAYSAPHQIQQPMPTPAPGALNYNSIPPTNARQPSYPPSNPGTQQHRNPSVPPIQQSRNPSLAPTNRAQSNPPVSASRRSAPMASSPSMSMAEAPHRTSTLIAVIVILDLGLAGAGAMLLAKGMSKPSPATKTTQDDAPKPALSVTNIGTGSAPAPADTATGSATASASGSASGSARTPSAGETGAGSGSANAAPGSPASSLVADPKSKHHGKKIVGNGKQKPDNKIVVVDKPPPDKIVPPDPVNTVPSPSITSEVNAKASSSSGVFLLCHNNAGDVHGRIQIAFEVEPTGQVDHVSSVENTTGSDQLASCLVNTISSWSFPPHRGDKAVFVRPFKYE